MPWSAHALRVSWMRKRLSRFLVLTLLVGLALAGWLFHYANTPMGVAGVAYPLAFSVERGATLKAACRDMQAVGALVDPWAFILIARMRGQAGDIKAGSYALDGPVTPMSLLRKITVGDTVLGKLTIVEGWSFAEMRLLGKARPDASLGILGSQRVADRLRAAGVAGCVIDWTGLRPAGSSARNRRTAWSGSSSRPARRWRTPATRLS